MRDRPDAQLTDSRALGSAASRLEGDASRPQARRHCCSGALATTDAGLTRELGYSDGLLPQFPETESIRARYLDRRLAPFWQQPARRICNSTDSRAIYDVGGISLPTNEPSAMETAEEIAECGLWDLSSAQRVKFDVFEPVDGIRCFEPRDDVSTAPHEPRPEHRPAIMRKLVTLDDWAADVRTCASSPTDATLTTQTRRSRPTIARTKTRTVAASRSSTRCSTRLQRCSRPRASHATSPS